MTHAELVDRAARWLQNTLRCGVVAKEIRAYTISRETPDCIGWFGSRELSVLVECKISKADFTADHRKLARRGGRAMGNWRFYLTPPGLLSSSQIPEGWGLYEVHSRSVRHTGGVRYRNAAYPPFPNPCIQSERAMLLSLVRRAHDWDRVIIGTNGPQEEMP